MPKQSYRFILLIFLLVALPSVGMNNTSNTSSQNFFSRYVQQKYNDFKGYFSKATGRLSQAEERMGLKHKGLLYTEESPLTDESFVELLKKKRGYDELNKLVSLYKPSIEKQKIINAQLNQEGHDKEPWQIFPIKSADETVLWAKGNNLDCLINAERARKLIEDEKLDLLVVPQKYVYKTGDGQLRVFAEPIEEGLQKPLNLKEVKQLFHFMKKTNFWDLAPRNVIRTADGKIAIIDTEDLSFFRFHVDPLSKDPYRLRDHNTFEKAEIGLQQHDMTQDAHLWLKNQFKSIQNRTIDREDAWKKRWDFASGKYDPSSINVKRIEKFQQGHSNVDYYNQKFHTDE